MNPKQIKSQLSKLSLKTPKWNKDKEGNDKPFASGVAKLNGKPLSAKITGNLFFTPTRQEHEEYGLSYRIGVEFNEPDVEFLDDLVNKLEEQMGDDWEVKVPHNEGKIYFKLQPNIKQNGFQCAINLPLTPTKLLHESIDRDMDVSVEFKLTPW
jgi:hypothetical protein